MSSALAIDGGVPVRGTLLSYGKPSLSEEDIQAITEVLRTDWLTTGPKVTEFEGAVATFTQSKETIAVSNGTAALHACTYALGIQQGDEVLVPTMTFAATANAVVFQGGKPVFVDSESDTLLIDPKKVEEAITKQTKAMICMDYTGHPCNYSALNAIAKKHNIPLIADASHAMGGAYEGRAVGTLADMNTFSFHPVKPMTTGEGGVITTHNATWAKKMRQFRNHCLTTDHRERQDQGSWYYEMTDLGYNYRLTDIQCALGISQLRHVPAWTKKRQEIARKYDAALSRITGIAPLAVRSNISHAYHLYVVLIDKSIINENRDTIFRALRAENIGVNVHYIPVHLHPYYQKNFATKKGDCPVAEYAYEHMLSLPIFPTMTNEDVADVIEALEKITAAYTS